MTEHGGTHLDAPVHFAAGQTTADKVELSRLVGEAVVIDVSAQSARDADYLISVDDVRRWEATHGRIGRGSRVLFRTGWSARWPDAVKYLGTALKGDRGRGAAALPRAASGSRDVPREGAADRRSSASTPRAWIAGSRRHSRRIASWRAAGVPGLENLTNLDKLPARGAMLVALPMKVGGGSGGPLRAVAVVPR